MIGYSSLFDEFSIVTIVAALCPSLVMMFISITVCTVIAKASGASKALGFLGIFGILGIIITIIIASSKIKNKQQTSNYQNYNTPPANNYNTPSANNYNTPPVNNGFQEQQNFNNNQNWSDDWANYNNTYNDDIINGDNYEFKGSMNVCDTHDGYDEKYSSVYGDYDDNKTMSYNLNGETIQYGKNVCKHCGAKLKAFATYCEECGSRV